MEKEEERLDGAPGGNNTRRRKRCVRYVDKERDGKMLRFLFYFTFYMKQSRVQERWKMYDEEEEGNVRGI